MADDLPSGKEFFEAARKALGYEKNLLCDEGKIYDGRETDGEFCMEVKFDVRLENLSREIAVECGQARFHTPSEHQAMDRQRIIPRGFIGKDILAITEREHRKELAAELRAAINALPPMSKEPKRVPPLVEDWLRAAWRGSPRLTRGEAEREM
jgi:hypothetical protein